MRFSDMMGSGEERSLRPSEIDSAISDALAPYLDTSATAETAVAVEAEPDAPAPRAHTVESVFPVVPVPVEAVAPVAPTAPVERAPVAANEPSATAIADFTPLSDDLLPRRRR